MSRAPTGLSGAGPGGADGGRSRAGGRRRPTLLAFPHAGAGASVYRDWGQLLAPDIDVIAMRLPGREERWSEPPRRTIRSVLEATEPQWGDACRPPYAVFGHSVGALAAFELVREIRRSGLANPAHLIVSGRVAPDVRSVRPVQHDLPDEELSAHLCALGGVSETVLANRAVRAMLLPALRADLACDEHYEYVPEPPLAVPVTVLSGADDPLVCREGLIAWAAQTTGPCTIQWMSGGHFFGFEHREEVLTCVRSALSIAVH